MEKKLHVLVVDDQEILARNIVDISLGNSNVEKVDMATNGRDALDMILKLKPDIVFTDMQMPYMTGLEVIKQIIESELEKKPQFVLITGDRSPNLVIASRDLKFNIEYKPISDMTINTYLDNFKPIQLKQAEDEQQKQVQERIEKKQETGGFFSRLFRGKLKK